MTTASSRTSGSFDPRRTVEEHNQALQITQVIHRVYIYIYVVQQYNLTSTTNYSTNGLFPEGKTLKQGCHNKVHCKIVCLKTLHNFM